MRKLRVVYDRWDDGWWVSRIPDVKGVHSNGRTVEEARRRVREALAEATDEGWDAKKAATVELVDELPLPAAAHAAIERRRVALDALQTAAKQVEAETERPLDTCMLRVPGRRAPPDVPAGETRPDASTHVARADDRDLHPSTSSAEQIAC